MSSRAAKTTKRHISSRRLYIGLVVVFGLLSVVEYALRNVPLVEPQTELGEFEKAQLDMFKQTNQLLTTLATAVIGATAGLLLKRDASKPDSGSADTARIVCSIVFAALSVYFGHLANSQLVFMLHSRFFNIYYGGIWLSSQLQFVAFLCSVLVLADATYRMVLRQEAGL